MSRQGIHARQRCMSLAWQTAEGWINSPSQSLPYVGSGNHFCFSGSRFCIAIGTKEFGLLESHISTFASRVFHMVFFSSGVIVRVLGPKQKSTTSANIQWIDLHHADSSSTVVMTPAGGLARVISI